jgi:Zn-dependent alcohol dehydrogenase
MKALVVNGLGRGFDLEDVEIAVEPAARANHGEAVRDLLQEVRIRSSGAIGGQKRVVGVNFGSTNAKRDIPMSARLYLQARMNLDDLVSKKIALREVNDGYAALKEGSLNRVVVTSF